MTAQDDGSNSKLHAAEIFERLDAKRVDHAEALGALAEGLRALSRECCGQASRKLRSAARAIEGNFQTSKSVASQQNATLLAAMHWLDDPERLREPTDETPLSVVRMHDPSRWSLVRQMLGNLLYPTTIFCVACVVHQFLSPTVRDIVSGFGVAQPSIFASRWAPMGWAILYFIVLGIAVLFYLYSPARLSHRVSNIAFALSRLLHFGIDRPQAISAATTSVRPNGLFGNVIAGRVAPNKHTLNRNTTVPSAINFLCYHHRDNESLSKSLLDFARYRARGAVDSNARWILAVNYVLTFLAAYVLFGLVWQTFFVMTHLVTNLS